MVPGLFSAEEAAVYKQHYLDLHARGLVTGADTQNTDPLKKFHV